MTSAVGNTHKYQSANAHTQLLIVNTAVIYAFTAVKSVGFHDWSVRAGFADMEV